MTEKRKYHIYLVIMFGAYMFLHTTTLLLANRASNGYISAALEENMYYIHMIFMIMGFVSFALLHRLLGKAGKIINCCILAVLTVGIALLCTIKTAWVFVGVGSAAVYCLGYLGGLVYWRMSMETANGSRTGLVMGIGCAVAYTLQYFLEGRSISPVLPAVIALAVFALGYVLLRHDETPEIAGNSEYNGEVKRPVICAVIIAAGFIFFNSFFNGYVHHLQIQSNFEQIDAYAWPRLLLVPMYLAFGLLGDFKHGKFVPIAALCAGLVTLLHSVLSASEAAYWINMCLFYVSIASAISYYNIIFWNIAPKTRHPEFWASAGRILDMLSVIVLGMAKFSALPTTAVLVLNIAVLAVVILTMAVNGDFNILTAETQVAAGEITDEDAFSALCLRCSLTPAEMKVARELVLTGDKQSEIADRLSIKLGTVQYHATNIYRKADVANRAALKEIYRSILKK